MSVLGEPTKLIAIRLPESIIQRLDIEIKPTYASRTEYIRQAIVDKLANGERLQEFDAINTMMSDRRLEAMYRQLRAELARRTVAARASRHKQ